MIEKANPILEKFDEAINRGAARARIIAKRRGHSVVVSRLGEIVHVPPSEIEIPAEFTHLEEEIVDIPPQVYLP